MTNGTRSALMLCSTAILAAFVALVAGCSDDREDAPRFSGQLGRHPAGYVNEHWADFLSKPKQCGDCHGSTTDRELAGGISKVSCFSCHVDGVHHTEGFADGARHGRNAAQIAPSDEPISLAGLASCKKCHGDDYRGKGIAVTCMACHTKAPHPNRPWTGRSAAVASHHMTVEGNAPACAQCHASGANSTRAPLAPPDPGAQPGCYNNTLCHARDI